MKMWIKVAALIGIFAAGTAALGTDLAVLQNGFSIRHDHREVIGAITRLYIGPDNTSYVDVPTFQIAHFEPDLTPPPPAPVTPATTVVPKAATTPPVTPPIKAPSLNTLISSASDRNNIDPDLISSVIHAESGFNARAVSPKGAQGLMQLMPQTAANLGVSNAFDPSANVEGGTKYLRELLELYNFDITKALAAYNAGPLRVQRYRGVPPYYETQAYVARIIREFNRKKLAERKAAALAAKKKSTALKSAPVARNSPQTQIIVENPHGEASR